MPRGSRTILPSPHALPQKRPAIWQELEEGAGGLDADGGPRAATPCRTARGGV